MGKTNVKYSCSFLCFMLCFSLALLALLGLTGCSKSSYNLTYTSETPIYNKDSLVGFTVTTKVEIKNYARAGTIDIPTKKLLYNKYIILPSEVSYITKEYVVYCYGKVHSMEINLLDKSYPIKDRGYLSYNESPDFCSINIASYLPKEFSLTIFYLLDETLNKTLDLTTYDWIENL